MSTGNRFLFTSESVTEGHPDKLCDQISDAVLDSVMAQDPLGRVACETATTTGLVFVTGEITTSAVIDYTKLVRDTIREIGYCHNQAGGFDADTCAVITAINKQSPDIANAVDQAWELRKGGASQQEINQKLDQIGAGDQGIMFGFACTETPELMPLPISLAHRLGQRLSQVRRMGELPYLRPDGKTQVTVEYEGFRPVRIDTVVISTQHAAEIGGEYDNDKIHALIDRDLRKQVIEPVVPAELLDGKTHYYINPSGRFVTGGPQGDAGLTGRKIIVDTYGGYARHGGGAFSGKDPTKVDRSGAYAARYVAKNIVAAGLADRCEVQLGYAIGVARPVSINVQTFGTGQIPEEQLLHLIKEHFELRPAGIIDHFNLRRPIFKQTAAFGHFGRPDLALPWEKLDKVEVLRRAIGASSSMPVSV